MPLEAIELPAPRVEPPASLAAPLRREPPRARLPRARQGLPRRGARLSRADRQPAGPGRASGATRREVGAGPRLVRRGGAGRDPLRRRHQRRRRGRAAGRGRLPRRGDDRPRQPRPGARGRSASRGRRGSRPARSGRRSRTSSASTGCTLRHFPQSFEFSTLGGWIATRAGGHFATLYTHIDDLVESVRAITPARRLGEPPAARLGRRPEPRPDAARLGGDPRRDHRGLGAGPGAAARQALVRGRVRLLRAPAPRRSASSRSPGSTRPTAACSTRRSRRSRTPGPPGKALLVLGFESAHHPVDGPMEIALEAARDHGGEPGEVTRRRRREPRPERAREPAGQGGRGRSRRRLAPRLPRRPLPARHVRRLRRPQRHLRDRDHLGPLPGASTRGHGDRPAGDRRGLRRRPGRPGLAPAVLPLHARLPGRPGALLHGPLPRARAAARSSSGTRSRRRSRRR